MSATGLRLDAEGVCLKAGRTQLLHDVGLTVLPGEFVGVLGPSGCGKSTLLRALCGQQKLSAGVVKIDSLDVRQWGTTDVGFVPQDDVVHTGLSVEKALRYSARLRMPDAEVEAALTQVLQQMELVERRRVRIDRLSGGQRKRVSIGIELLTRPRLLFLDEPTSGLDPALEMQFMDLCRSLAGQGRTLVMTTHIMQSLDRLDLILVLVAGRIAYFGPPTEAIGYFSVSHLQEVYGQLQADQAEPLAQRYLASPQCSRYVSGRRLP